MTRLLVLMGSGETTPTMVEIHKRILGRVGDDARLVDTTYGFQENADDLTAATQQYFRHNVGHEVTAIELRDTAALSPAALEDRLTAAEQADWLFAGPGSPTYALRQWAPTRFGDVIRGRLGRDGTATIFASAAVCSIGAFTVPVYEIYKVGETPFWATGLDIVAELNLSCVVIPHFDNTEGRGHDTRFCYLGERRLAMLEEDLPDDVWVLGIDEHTAVTIDLDTEQVTIEGRGGITVRVRGRQSHFTASGDLTLSVLREAARGGDQARDAASAHADPKVDPDNETTFVDDGESELLRSMTGFDTRFREALDQEDAVSAADVVLAMGEELRVWEADSLQSDDLARGRAAHDRLVVALARAAQSGLHDHDVLLAPFVDLLLELRAAAREAKDFAASDRIRDVMAAGDVEVRDTKDGVTWTWTG